SHGIDAIRYLTGKSFSRVSATQGNVSRAEQGSMEEYCIATFDLAGGGAAVVHADYLRPNQLPTHSDDRIRIAGDRGIVEIRDSRCLLTDNDGTREITAQPRRVSRELLRALEGDTSLFSTADSLALAEILLHARDAADHRHPVELGVPAGAAGGDSPPGKVYDRQRLPKVQIPTTVRLPRAETERA
ncbi:MAG TPA: hypothetical protein DCX07_00150, partial [Phycisphaerales bacterium]|nr:hypothetical protein [Phycisphaerales bacterium]